MATTPGLRGLAPAHLAAAAGIAMVMVNTVGFVQGDLGLGDRAAALAFAAFGAGSVGGALAAPALMAAAGDRGTMLGGCALVAGGLLLGGLAAPGYGGLLALWALVGAGSAAALTPAQALLRRVAPARELGVLYAALFALANLALLVAYPAAGWLGTALDPPAALAAAGGLAAVAGLAAARGLARAATPPAG
jgi:MFS family permease